MPVTRLIGPEESYGACVSAREAREMEVQYDCQMLPDRWSEGLLDIYQDLPDGQFEQPYSWESLMNDEVLNSPLGHNAAQFAHNADGRSPTSYTEMQPVFLNDYHGFSPQLSSGPVDCVITEDPHGQVQNCEGFEQYQPVSHIAIQDGEASGAIDLDQPPDMALWQSSAHGMGPAGFPQSIAPIIPQASFVSLPPETGVSHDWFYTPDVASFEPAFPCSHDFHGTSSQRQASMSYDQQLHGHYLGYDIPGTGSVCGTGLPSSRPLFRSPQPSFPSLHPLPASLDYFVPHTCYELAPNVNVYRDLPISHPDEPPFNPLIIADRGPNPRKHHQNYRPIKPAGDHLSSRSSRSRYHMMTDTMKPSHRLSHGDSGPSIQSPIMGRRREPTDSDKCTSSSGEGNGACWACVMQRDICSGGETCTRCAARLGRDESHLLNCTRKNLRDMTPTLLPDSMLAMHKQDYLSEYRDKRVKTWCGKGISVALTIGFGPSFEWQLHEFEPAWPSLLSRQISDWNSKTQLWETSIVASPPLAVKDLIDPEAKLTTFVGKVVDEGLVDLSTAYDDEGEDFKSRTIKMLCALTAAASTARPQHKRLVKDLKKVLEMIVCTYIMNHALAITAESRDKVLAQISLKQEGYPKTPSPWLASMQLRHFFAQIRSYVYSQNLYNLQQILHRSTGKKQRTTAFATVLGMAFVLEECQHTLLAQAEGRVFRKEASKAESYRDLKYECGEIDHEFEFLCNLLHCKFQNGRMTQKASLSNWIDLTSDPVEKAFLSAVHDACAANRGYLEGRKQLELKTAADNNHSSRLISRLLLGLM